MLRVVAILALAASLSVTGTAAAHVGGVEREMFEAPQAPIAAEPRGLEHVLSAGDPADIPWTIPMAALLLGAALMRRRWRRPVVVALALLVAVFAVEAAVHSVHHHGAGADPVACPTAWVGAHLDGTNAATLALDEPIHRIGAVAAPADPLVAALRSRDPSSPRAPPSPLV
jgi:hypothetical protein